MICTDLAQGDYKPPCRFETLEICEKDKFEKLVKENNIDYIVHLAAIVSALGEK